MRLYRQITADLAVAQRDFPGIWLTGLLNQLVTRAHAAIYRHAPEPLARLRQFYLNDLPREYRAAWRFNLASAALLFLPLILVALAVIVNRDSASLLIPQGVLSEIQHGQTWFDSTPSERPFLASFIMTNNMEVAFLALASGIFGAVGTVVVLVYNGSSLARSPGPSLPMVWPPTSSDSSAPHGFLELSVVVVSGGCGLMLGHAVLWPGLSPRGRALVKAAKRAMTLLLGLLPALVVAGLLEGLVSPITFPVAVQAGNRPDDGNSPLRLPPWAPGDRRTTKCRPPKLAEFRLKSPCSSEQHRRIIKNVAPKRAATHGFNERAATCARGTRALDEADNLVYNIQVVR